MIVTNDKAENFKASFPLEEKSNYIPFIEKDEKGKFKVSISELTTESAKPEESKAPSKQ